MICTKCGKAIVPTRGGYFRTKRGPHHLECGIKNSPDCEIVLKARIVFLESQIPAIIKLLDIPKVILQDRVVYLESRISAAFIVLDVPNASGIEDAARQVKQAAISYKDACDQFEFHAERAEAALANRERRIVELVISLKHLQYERRPSALSGNCEHVTCRGCGASTLSGGSENRLPDCDCDCWLDNLLNPKGQT